MNHDHSMITGENKIRCPGQATVVQAIPKTQTVQSMSNQTLRRRIPTADAGHHTASGFCIDTINQHQPLRNTPT